MATEVYTSEEIVLRDGTTVDLVPLSIKNLRKFMRTWQGFLAEVRKNFEVDEESDDRISDEDINDREFDVYIELCALSLEKSLAEAGKEFKNKELIEYLEDTLNREEVFYILDKCGGLKLNDPNLQAQAMQMVQDGMN